MVKHAEEEQEFTVRYQFKIFAQTVKLKIISHSPVILNTLEKY